MMSKRKGDSDRDWTTSEVEWLISNAGIISRREICRELKRSKRSVESMAARLRMNGRECSLRVFKRLTSICPKCGSQRSMFDKRTGFCRVCIMRSQLEDARRRQDEAYARLTISQRSVYDSEESRLDNSLPPKPKPISASGMDWQHRLRTIDINSIAEERWLMDCMTRRINSTKQRTKRMREKTGTNPSKIKNS